MQFKIKDDYSRIPAARINAFNEVPAQNMVPPRYQIRFKNPATLPLADGPLKVGASGLFTQSRIKDRLLNEISSSVRAVIVRLLKKLAAVRLGPSTLTFFKEI